MSKIYILCSEVFKPKVNHSHSTLWFFGPPCPPPGGLLPTLTASFNPRGRLRIPGWFTSASPLLVAKQVHNNNIL
jgi:hypothetical protein